MKLITTMSGESNNHILNLEKQWRNSLLRFTNKELLEIFPEAPKVLREQILETLDRVIDARFRIFSSYWRSLKSPEAKPICEATAELIWENELQPLQRRLNKLIFQHKLMTDPKSLRNLKRINAEKIKEIVDLKEIIEKSGVKLRKIGRRWLGLCPFHPEKNPSFHVYKDHFHCYGCGAHGDVFTFIQLKEGLDFKETLKVLSKYYG